MRAEVGAAYAGLNGVKRRAAAAECNAVERGQRADGPEASFRLVGDEWHKNACELLGESPMWPRCIAIGR